MKNNSPFFPTGTPIDRFYDKNGDGKLSGMETAFRDAALIQSHKASVKSSDSASNNNLSFSFRSGTNTGNGLGDSGFFAFSNEENQAEYVADEAEQAEDEDFLNDDDAVNTEEESDIYPVEAEDGSDDETPGEYEPEEDEIQPPRGTVYSSILAPVAVIVIIAFAFLIVFSAGEMNDFAKSAIFLGAAAFGIVIIKLCNFADSGNASENDSEKYVKSAAEVFIENLEKIKRPAIVIGVIFLVVIGIVCMDRIIYTSGYNKAISYMISSQYDAAKRQLDEYRDDDFRDADALYRFCIACENYQNHDYKSAYYQSNDLVFYDLKGDRLDFVEQKKDEIKRAYVIYGAVNENDDDDDSSFYDYETTTEETTTETTTRYYYTTRRQSEDDDPYNASDYSNEEDFYYDHYYDFFDYYEAEDYYRDHRK